MADLEKGNAAAGKKQTEKPAKAKKPSIFARASKWSRELKGEIRKIVWPTREQTTNNTVVVLVTILIVGVFIWVLDAVFNLGVTKFISHFS